MKHKILVVDDEPDLIKLTVYRLKKAGYEVTTAVDGCQAVELVGEINPDLVLLDLNLPGIKGSEVCRQIKANDETKNIPVILFSASGDSSVAQKAKQLGADDYLYL